MLMGQKFIYALPNVLPNSPKLGQENCRTEYHHTKKSSLIRKGVKKRKGAPFPKMRDPRVKAPDVGSAGTRKRAKRRRHVKISLKTLILIWDFNETFASFQLFYVTSKWLNTRRVDAL
ncbi:hypothetical protein CEXT_803311 [Caerostris extrusa]|uniref:Uncharacterized protein n=1 Tax=Caerostris extrusa TaxID=172846 RepID=A0AAV4QXE8_CAEEX|nr:hypothetical protein CEXT_803311 [Caerostris extrusa]